MTTEGTPTPPKASTPKQTRWTFTVEAVGEGPPTVARVRRLLKSAWRAYGLRCVTLAEVPQAAPDATEAAPMHREGQGRPLTPPGGNVTGEGNGADKGKVRQ